MFSTFTQLGAEIIGHPRGSGALKLEPSGAHKLVLHLPHGRSPREIDATLQRVNDCLLQLDFDGARLAADEFLFSDCRFTSALTALRDGLATVRQRRAR
jgi:hypothetical protein